mgnify:CR=1 FL=1
MIAIEYAPDSFKLEETTVWSFPDRGKWATHSGKYRGNWTPYVPRNLILRYSAENAWILDQFLGSGTTLIEAKLLGRNALGIDINPNSIKLSNQNLSFEAHGHSKILTKLGNARDLSFIKNESMDMICTHPPYADIIRYSSSIEGDISHLAYDEFLEAMMEVAAESYRVLKRGKICAFMIGDIRKRSYIRPLGMDTMKLFEDVGFQLKEIVVKKQHNCRSTDYWKNKNKNFLLLEHEYVFVLEKNSIR